MRIHKYQIELRDSFLIEMEEGAVPLCVQVQWGAPCLWAIVDPEAPLVDHLFFLAGIGHDRNDLPVSKYIGTFQLEGGALVFHLFDGGEPPFKAEHAIKERV